MSKRGIPAGTPDFDAAALKGASNQVGILGVEPARLGLGFVGWIVGRILAFFR